MVHAMCLIVVARLCYALAWSLHFFVHFLVLTRNPVEPDDVDTGWDGCADLGFSC